ncbi:LysE family translocator [Roseivivax sp. CAU 1761]
MTFEIAMPAAEALATSLLAGLALNLAPGADVMFALASGIQGGRRAGIAAAAGISLGCLVHAVLTALGAAAALAAVPWGLDALRWAGAAYLLWLAVSAWRAPPFAGGQGGVVDPRRAVMRGLMTNVLNPKVALFVLAFLPQFADPARGAVWSQILVLGLLFSATAFGVTALYGGLAGLAQARLRRHGTWLGRIAAGVYAALALRVAAG